MSTRRAGPAIFSGGARVVVPRAKRRSSRGRFGNVAHCSDSFVGTVACRPATVWALLSRRINRERPSKGPWPDSRPREKRLNANRSCTPTVTWPLVFQSRARLYRDRKSAPPATFSSAFFFSRSVSALLASRGAQSRAACLHVASCLAATCVSLGRASFSSLDLLRRPAISGQLECRE